MNTPLKISVLSWIAIASVFFSVGCAHQPSASDSAPTVNLEPSAFWADQSARRDEMRRVSAKIKLRYRTKKESVAGQGRLILQLPEQVRLEMRDPLGRLHYVVTLQEPEFTALYPRKNFAISDQKAGAAYVRRFLGLEFSFSELQDVFLGILPESIKKNAFDSWEWDGKTKEYVGKLNFPDKRVVVRIEPQRAVMKSVSVEVGKRREEVVYEDFAPCCKAEGSSTAAPKIVVAQAVVVRRPSEKSSVEMEWEEILSIKAPRENDVFKAEVPEGTRRVVLE